ncbi:MAG: hypothetical protein ABIJ65_04225 [Chloroflexota bacterium]
MNKMEKKQTLHLIQRESAGYYLLLTLVSFAVSVTLIRLFLSLTNYPQLGEGTLHIAHVLWGGLLLYVASLLPLLYANREIYKIAAIFTGTGVGLFIDEVGKFITAQNDYFFPIAAAIIYAFFLLTLLLFINIRRNKRQSGRDELIQSIGSIWKSLYVPLLPGEVSRLKAHLEIAANTESSQTHKNLAQDLLKFVEADAPGIPEMDHKPQRKTRMFVQKLTNFLTNEKLRPILILGLLFIGLLTMKNPFSVLLAPWLPAHVTDFLTSLYLGRHIDVVALPFWYSLRLGLEILVGSLLLTAAGLFMLKKDRQAAFLGYIALLLSLATVNLLLFYFEQFSSIITTTIQFLLLLGIVRFRKNE